MDSFSNKYTKTEIDLLIANANNNDVDAQQELAFWYEEGLSDENGISILDKNIENAIFWYKKAALQGDSPALTRLGDLFSEGIGCNKNIDVAIEYYNKAIEKGNSSAAANLGVVYRDLKKHEKAFELYKKAEMLLTEEWKQPVRILNTGLCYLYGIGTVKNTTEAVNIFKFISENNSNSNFLYEVDEANFLLGQIYLSGEYIEKDIDLARKYLLLANEDNDHRSAQELLHIIGKE